MSTKSLILMASCLVAFGCGGGGGGDGGSPDGGGGDTGGGDTGGGDTGGGNTGDFEMAFSGYGPHSNNEFHLRVIEEGQDEVVGSADTTITNGDFTVNIDNILEDGASYTVDWYADLNGNGSYDAPQVDHAWRSTGNVADTDGLSLTHAHDTDWTDIMWVD